MGFLSQAIKVTKNKYASQASKGVMYDPSGWIDSGNLLLNAQISGSMFKGIPTNMTMVFGGDPSVGKTFLVLGICRKFLDSDPTAEVVYFESEGAIKTKTLSDRGIDLERIALFPVKTVEELKVQMFAIIKEAKTKDPMPKLLFCLDSLGNLATTKEIEDTDKGHEAGDMGLKAKQIRAMMRVLRMECSLFGFPFLVTAHTYTGGSGNAVTMEVGGGKGIVYNGDTIVMLTRSKVKEGEEFYEKGGSRVTSRFKKSRDTRDNTAAPFMIDYIHGLTKFSGLFDFCYETGIIVREGNKYRVKDLPESPFEFRKRVMEDPESFFTAPVLAKIDEYLGAYFNYGSAIELKEYVAPEDQEEKSK